MQSQAWLRLHIYSAYSSYCYANFYCISGKTQQNPGLECLLWIKTEGTSQVLFHSSKGTGGANHNNFGKCQTSSEALLTCYIVMRITVNSVCHAYNC